MSEALAQSRMVGCLPSRHDRHDPNPSSLCEVKFFLSHNLCRITPDFYPIFIHPDLTKPISKVTIYKYLYHPGADWSFTKSCDVHPPEQSCPGCPVCPSAWPIFIIHCQITYNRFNGTFSPCIASCPCMGLQMNFLYHGYPITIHFQIICIRDDGISALRITYQCVGFILRNFFWFFVFVECHGVISLCSISANMTTFCVSHILVLQFRGKYDVSTLTQSHKNK